MLAGPTIPNQFTTSKSLMPLSAMVGTSGSSGVRALAATPIALILLVPSMFAMEPSAANMVDTWPPIKPVSERLAP